MKKKTVVLAMTLGMLFAQVGTAAAEEAKDYSGHTLYVANWQAYSSDTNYCEQAFEDKFGCTVEHVYFNSYDELMTTLQTGGNAMIDAVVLSQNYTQYFHEQGLLKRGSGRYSELRRRSRCIQGRCSVCSG